MQVKARIARLAAAGVASFAVAGALTVTAAPAVATATTGEAQQCAVNLQTQKTACANSAAQAAQLAGVGAQSVKAVTLYDGINYTSVLVTYYVAASCTPAYDGEYGVSDLGVYSNRASSVQTFNQCDVHLHDPINYGTPYSTWIDQSSNLANIGTGWSNRASSIGIS